MRDEAAQAERWARAALSAQSALKIQAVIDDEHITGQLDALERGMIEDLIGAQDSAKRDRCAAEINAHRKVRAALGALAFNGRQSGQKLDQHQKAVKNNG